MIVWRVANKAYKTLEGLGGLYASGRWHSKGRPIVYTGDHAALSALEVLVHMDMDLEDLPEYVMLEIRIPDTLHIYNVALDASDPAICSAFGDKWLVDKESAVCKVSSIIIPSASNYLINPLHPEANEITIVDEQAFSFDDRLFEIGS